MKNGKSLHEAQKEHRDSVKLLPCLACNKKIEDGYYARFGDGGVCSKTCMNVQAKKPRFPEYSEENYLKRFQLE